MKSKRGFTLIELLAVIVILAIIALIATPIVLGIIEDARSSAKERSAELVIQSVELAYSTAFMQDANGSTPTLEQVQNNFKMESAEWKVTKDTDGNVTGHTIVTNDDVECTVTSEDNSLYVACPVGDKTVDSSASMEISG